MSSFEKYRIHEVAKDFGKSSKEISEILTEYATTPKNHMQVLENGELDLIFEYLTQHNQIESIAEVFAEPPKPVEKKPADKKTEPAAEQAKGAKLPQQTQQKPQQSAQPAAQTQQAPAAKQEKPQKAFVPRAVPEKRVIDTRGSTNMTRNSTALPENAARSSAAARKSSPAAISSAARSSRPRPSAVRRR